jgi:hypothetical protein
MAEVVLASCELIEEVANSVYRVFFGHSLSASLAVQ